METDPGVQETPAVPAELAGPLPRKARLTGNGVMTVILAAILLLFGGLSGLHIYTLIVQRTQQATLPRAGIKTTSEVKRVWFKGRARVPTVSYDFEANGKSVAGEAPVPRRLLQNVEESKTLSVRYLPGKPAVNFPAAWTPPAVPGWGSLILFLIPFVGVDAVILLLLWRQGQLVAQGVPATAVVTKCSRTRSGYRVKYEFRTAEGRVIPGGGWCKSRQEVGAKIWILHSPQNPQRSRPYPMPALRVALP